MAYVISILLFPSTEQNLKGSKVLRQLLQYSCQGYIRVDPTSKGCKGQLRDHGGISDLTEIVIPNLQGSSERLSFVKRYESKGEREALRFTLACARGDLWLGTFEGRQDGIRVSGDCRCDLHEIPDEFFDPEHLFQRDPSRHFQDARTPATP